MQKWGFFSSDRLFMGIFFHFYITKQEQLKQRYQYFEYEITDDPDFIFDLLEVPRELRQQFPSLHPKAIKGGKRIIQKLKNLIELHPNAPQLKNYLSVAYHESGMSEEAYELNRSLVTEHPAYLFGRLNLAFEYFNKKEYKRIPEMLGPLMELKELYPERDKFHIGEVTGFYKLAIMYYCATGNLEAAEARYNIMDEIAEEHPDTKEVAPHIVQARLKAAQQRMEEEEKTRISVVPQAPPRRTGLAARPAFNHPEIDWLYENGLRIGAGKLSTILALPRESLMDDLNAVLEDSMNRFDYFHEIIETEGWQEETMNFLVHAIFLLGELRATQSLPLLLKTLGQGKEFLDLWYGDFLTGELWEPLFQLGSSQTELLKSFVLTPGTDTYARSLVCSSIAQMAHHKPGRKKEFTGWFKSLFTTLAAAKLEENIIDSDFIGLAICDAVELRDPEQLPSITVLYQRKYVAEGICGSLLDVARDMNAPHKPYYKKELLGITDRYHKIITTWAGYTNENEQKGSSPPPVLAAKTGRNDPCPCGSGKKYKKCCLQ
jgi:hypothetical protein